MNRARTNGRGVQTAEAWTGRNPSEDQYLDEATALFALLTDGAFELGYHVQRTMALRDASSKRLLPWSYTREWRPARERHADGTETDRVLNPYVLRQHIVGRYDVAWQWPSWTSLCVLDIDRPEVVYQPGEAIDPARELAANMARDQVLAAVWRAFGCDANKQPVVLCTPGAGYHVYLPLLRREGAAERTWPAAWARELVEHHLNQHGLELRPGRLELWPAGTRLRAPCGAQMALLVPQAPDDADDLGLALMHAAWRQRGDREQLHRDVGATVRSFVAAVEASRRPLHDWIDQARPCWSATWGPFGDRGTAAAEKNPTSAPRGRSTPSPHKEDVFGGQGLGPLDGGDRAESGWLLYGQAFVDRIRDLTETGILYPGERHDAVLKLTWWWGRVWGFDRAATLERVREWLEAFAHCSATRDRSPARFTRESLREAAHYYDRRVAVAGVGSSAPRGIDVALRPLPDVDRDAILAKVDRQVHREVEALCRYLRGAADGGGRVPHPVDLARSVQERLCGERRVRAGVDGVVKRRRATVMAIEELVRIGVIALHTNYSTGNHGKLYTCWYVFGSGQLPAENASGQLVLAHRAIEEGALVALADDERGVRVELAAETAGAGAVRDERDPWWVRMYARRAFTPAEFLEGDARKIIPGPFRHRYPARSDAPPCPADAGVSAERSEAAPAAVEATVPDDSAPVVKDGLQRALERAWQAWFQRSNE